MKLSLENPGIGSTLDSIDITPRTPLERFKHRVEQNKQSRRGQALEARNDAQTRFNTTVQDFGKRFSELNVQKQRDSTTEAIQRLLQARSQGMLTQPQGLLPQHYQQALPQLGSQVANTVAGLDPDLQWIIQRESSGRTNADNPTSTAFGLGQLLQANREHYGAQLGFDPNTTDFNQQLQMMLAYIRDRYGTPANARRFWEQNHWY